MPFEHLHLPLPNGGRREKERQLSRLVELIIERNIDLVYLRRELWHPSFRRLMQQVPTVVEVNTRESAEFKLTMSLPKRIYARLTQSSWRKYPSGYVSMTKELTKGLPATKPVAVIPNGIPRGFERSAQGEIPHLFLSCTGAYAWHGIDKYVRLATSFQSGSLALPVNCRATGPMQANRET